MKHLSIKISGLVIIAALISFGFTKIGATKRPKTTRTDTALKIYKDPQITAFFKRETGWIASDGAYSIPMDNGSVLWTFGDSFTNDYDVATASVPCLFNVRNCVMLQPFNNWDWNKTITGLSPTKSTLFRSDTTFNHFNWPAGGFQIKDTAYVFCFAMQNVTTGMGFASAGPNAFAKIKLPEMKVAGYHKLRDVSDIEFGTAFVKDVDAGYIYVYGSKGRSITKNEIYIARIPITNPNADWAFWDGSNWNTDVKKALPIGESPYLGGNVSKVKNKYLLLTTDLSVGCDMGTNIYYQVSNSLTGTFSKAKLLYTLDDTLKGHYPFFYLAAGHPEYINDKDELLITYCINGYGTCVNTCINNRFNPNYYRPRGIRVPLKLIDPSL